MTVPPGSPPAGGPPSPTAVASTTGAINMESVVAVAQAMERIKKETQETNARVSVLAGLIKDIAAKDQVDFAKNFISELAELKAAVTKDIDDFTDKYRTFQQYARDQRVEAEKELMASMKLVAETQQATLNGIEKLFGNTDKAEQYRKAITDSLSATSQEVQTISSKIAQDYVESITDKADLAKQTFEKLATSFSENGGNVGDFEKALKQLGFTQQQIADNNQLSIKIDSQIIQQYKERILLGTSDNETKQKSEAVGEKLLEQEKASIAANIEKNILLAQSNKLIAEQALLKLKLADNDEKLSKANERLAGDVSGLADKFLGSSKQSNLFSNSLASAAFNIKAFTLRTKEGESSIGNFFKGAVDSIGNLGSAIFKPLFLDIFNLEDSINRLGGFLYKNLIESTFKFDEALSQVNKSTGGFGKEFEKVAMDTGAVFSTSAVGNLAKYGITLTEFSQTYGKLANSIGGFNNLLDEQRKSLTESAAKLELLGISAETFSKLTVGMMGALKRSDKEVKEGMDELARAALGLKVSVEKYTTEFQAMFSKLIGYGKEATQIFKEFSAISQATSGALSTQDLLTFAESFQKFDTGAESLSKFNAIFGGTLDMARLMRTGADNPAQILMEIKRAAQASGIEFDKLNVYQQRFLAEAFGGDVQKSMAFFKMDLEKVNELMNSSNASEKEKEERIQRSKTAMDKFNAAMENMRISLSPILEVITSIAEGITAMSEASPWLPFITFTTVLVGMVAGAFALLERSITRGIGGAIAKITGDTGGLKTAFSGVTTELGSLEQSLVRINAQLATMKANMPVGGLGALGQPTVVGGLGGLGQPTTSQPTGGSQTTATPAAAATPVSTATPATPTTPRAPSAIGGMGAAIGGAIITSLVMAGINYGVNKAFEADRIKAMKEVEAFKTRKRTLNPITGELTVVNEPENDMVMDVQPNFLTKSAGSGVQVGSVKQPLNNEDFIGVYGPSNGSTRQIIASKGGGLMDKLFVDILSPKFRESVSQYYQIATSSVQALVTKVTEPSSIIFKPFEVISQLTTTATKQTDSFVEVQKQKTANTFAASKELTERTSTATNQLVKSMVEKQVPVDTPEIKNNLQVELMIPELGGRLGALITKQATKIAENKIENFVEKLAYTS